MIRHVFVYGTLMPGRSRWPALAPWAVGGPVADAIDGDLFDTGYGWPAATFGGGGLVPGFSVELHPESVSEALEVLDEIEGTAHGLFSRVPVVTATAIDAWVYEWAGETTGFGAIREWDR